VKFSLPKGLFVFVCLLASTSAFAMEFDPPPILPKLDSHMDALMTMQHQGYLSAKFRVKAGALLFVAVDDLGKLDAPKLKLIEETLSTTMTFLRVEASKEKAALSLREEAVDTIASQYLTIRGVDDLLRRLEKRLANRGLGSDYDVAEYIRDVIKDQERLKDAAIGFGGLVYRFTLSATARE
jgi:hypothetical protein